MRFILLFSVSAFSMSSFGNCTIKNDTNYDFTVEYGNVSNHSFGANHVESFPPGPVKGKSSKGKSFSVTCSGSESWVVIEEGGAVVVKKR